MSIITNDEQTKINNEFNKIKDRAKLDFLENIYSKDELKIIFNANRRSI
jgi:hypothetical protein